VAYFLGGHPVFQRRSNLSKPDFICRWCRPDCKSSMPQWKTKNQLTIVDRIGQGRIYTVKCASLWHKRNCDSQFCALLFASLCVGGGPRYKRQTHSYICDTGLLLTSVLYKLIWQKCNAKIIGRNRPTSSKTMMIISKDTVKVLRLL